MAKAKKKKSSILPLIIIVVLIVIAAALLYFTPVKDPRQTMEVEGDNLELIALPSNDSDIIVHNGFTLKYSEEHEQPYWVAYVLTPEETVVKAVSRSDNFRADPAIPTGSATLADYKGSGYDRGHLAPFADLSWSEESASDSFLLSNMSPQAGSLNRGRWADLESVIRTFSLSGPICVVTGPVLTDGPYKTIGQNKVAVPNYFYKVVLFYSGQKSRAIGFLLPNEACKEPLKSYAVSVDYIEQLTGIDFFSMLPDDVEDVLESSFDTDLWDFSDYSAKVAASYGYSADTAKVTPIQVTTFEIRKDPQTAEEKILYFLYVNFSSIKIELLELFGYSLDTVKDITAALVHR